MEAAEGMDAIINLSVVRRDPVLAFQVNTLGCYNVMLHGCVAKFPPQ